MLERPPSERYRRPQAAVTTQAGSTALATFLGLVPAIVGAVVFWVLAGPLAFSAGLVVVAFLIGRFAGLLVRAGGGTRVGPQTRVLLALALTLAALGAGNVATWLFALSEGGVLTLPDYLNQAFGLLVPVELLVGSATAWFSAR